MFQLPQPEPTGSFIGVMVKVWPFKPRTGLHNLGKHLFVIIPQRWVIPAVLLPHQGECLPQDTTETEIHINSQ